MAVPETRTALEKTKMGSESNFKSEPLVERFPWRGCADLEGSEVDDEDNAEAIYSL